MPKAELTHLAGQRNRGALSAATTLHHLLTDEHARVEEGAGRDHDRLGWKQAQARLQADDAARADNQLQRLGDDQLDAALAKQFADSAAVELTVRLDPRPPHRRTLAAVEHPAVNRRAVCSTGHQPVEHV